MKKILGILSLLILAGNLTAAEKKDPKKALSLADYGKWKSISAASISNDGQWVSYAYQLPRNNDTLYIRSLSNDSLYVFPHATTAEFTNNSAWAVVKIQPDYKTREKLKKEKKTPVTKIQYIHLPTGLKTTIDRSVSWKTDSTSRFMAVQLMPADPKSKAKGKDILLVNFKEGSQQRLSHISDFSFNKSGTHLAWLVETPDSIGNGAFLFDLSSRTTRPLDNDKKVYSQLSWNERGTALAFLKGTTPRKKVHRQNQLLLLANLNDEELFTYDPTEDTSFPENWVISENGNLSVNKRKDQVFYGIRPQQVKLKPSKDTATVNVDIWHWKDDRIQSEQIKQASRDKKFTFLSTVHTSEGKYIRIADSTLKYTELSRDGRWVIGRDQRAYISDWKESKYDYYRVDTRSGERTLIQKGMGRSYGMSPDSKHYLFWNEGAFYLYNMPDHKYAPLTAQSPVSFVNDEYDHPGTKPPFGVSGWTRDGKSVILRHKYDLWLQPLSGEPARCLTREEGQKNEIIFRYVETDREARFIDLDKPLLLSAFGRWTKDAGFYLLEDAEMKELTYGPRSYGRRVQKAQGANTLYYTMESPSEYPDYYVSDLTFKKPEKITDANPIVEDYIWYHNELLEYTNKDGVRLQAVLMIPDTWKKGEKLPMLVDFYEKKSQALNTWSRIVYRDTPMFPKYCSNGYLVLLPDVHFNGGTTHIDMKECVEAAVQKAIELGYADPEKVGIHGHSFSGQGGNYIVTHSDMFAAACIGAGVANLVSDFNQLWKDSGTNQHGYDYYGQGRFGTNPYDDYDLYFEQSAVFHARNMNTPLLLLQGTADGAVEWLQAVEFYNGLRFNGKNVILCSYPGEPHHLRKWENQIDFQTRMEQFYDHYLKGKPAPKWMQEGVPHLLKEYQQIGK